VTAADAGLVLLLSGAALLAISEIGKRRRVRMVGVAASLAGCAITIPGLLAQA